MDDEFENVSCHLLKRTQAMVDKYRHLLFEESKVSFKSHSLDLFLCLDLMSPQFIGILCVCYLEQRLGPSAEMVMIDRMFIQEEKVALSQDRVLAKEKPGND